MMVVILLTAVCVPQTNTSHFATQKGSIIKLSPLGASFHIPQDWLDWNRRFHNNLHLTRQDLESVKDGAGEWDTEYAKVVNAALPFNDCSAHVGGEGWGLQGSSFGDLQMRVYLTDQSEKDIIKRISELAFAAAKTVRKNSQVNPTITPPEHTGEWSRIITSYQLWYVDYGGTAHVGFLYQCPECVYGCFSVHVCSGEWSGREY